MRAMTSSACLAPNSVSAASRGVLPPISAWGVVKKRRARLAILPDVLGHGDNAGQPLRAFAFRRTEPFPPPFVGRLGDDPMHQGALLGSTGENAPRHVAKGPLGQATFDGVVQLKIDVAGLSKTRSPPRISPIWRGSSIGIIIPISRIKRYRIGI